jgi:hypothetical protein
LGAVIADCIVSRGCVSKDFTPHNESMKRSSPLILQDAGNITKSLCKANEEGFSDSLIARDNAVAHRRSSD